MQTVDYIVLASYLLFLLTLGPVFNRFNRNASDYFRAGGTMVWWVAGTAIIMGGFSAWAFTGGAARVYETGFFFLVLFLGNFVADWFTLFFLARKFRQMRVVTVVEAIRKRFGPFNEQVFTWIQVPLRLFYAGLALYTLAVFFTGAFPTSAVGALKLDMPAIVVILGVIVTVMAVAGGAWAINAGQFVQAILFLAITTVMSAVTLAHPKVGGLSGLLKQMPDAHLKWTAFERPSILALFIVTLVLNQLIQRNSLQEGGAKFLIVKNGRDAVRVTILSIVCTLILTPMWMIPAMGSLIVHPDLASQYPALKNPNEAAYIAMAQTTLPPGLLGLLICAIFSASLDALSSGVNVAAAVLVRNFYIVKVDPHASESKQVWIGRVLSICGGVVMIGIALGLQKFSRMPLYSLLLLSAAAIGLPQAVPMFLGLFSRRAPAWSLWSTLLIGFSVSIFLAQYLTSARIGALWHGLNAIESNDLKVAIVTAVLLVVCCGWFWISALIGRRKMSADERMRVDAFFDEMNTPIDMAAEHVGGYEDDARQYNVLAMLNLIFGGFIASLAVLNNTLAGRVGLLGCGGVIAIVGAIIFVLGKRRRPLHRETIHRLEPVLAKDVNSPC